MTQGSICWCGRITDGAKHCDDHKRKDKRPSSNQRGYNAEWRATRKAYLAANPWCVRCGSKGRDVHHVDGLGPKGPRGHDWDNLETLCHSCHSVHTAEAQPPGSTERGAYWSDPFIVIMGPSGVGKTAVRDQLVRLTGATPMGPDDFEDRWTTLLDRLDGTRHAVVECVLLHSGLRKRIIERGAKVVQLTAPTWVLRDRMDRRGDTDRTIQQRIDQTFEVGYGQEIPPDLTLEVSDATPAETAERILSALAP